MIEKNEILSFARNLSLSLDTVEKDYVLGWMLYGIGEHLPSAVHAARKQCCRFMHSR